MFQKQVQSILFGAGKAVPIIVASMLLLGQATISLAAPKGKAASTKATTDKSAEKTDKPATDKPAAKAMPEAPIENVVNVTTGELVDKPRDFLNKNVKFTSKFYVFSNLPLDYKPAMRSSKTHLGFLVLRPDGHVPFSELKITMPIPKEKEPMNQLLGTLKDGDQIEVIAKVFSNQLDEPWIEVLRLKRLSSAPDDKDKKDDKTASADKSTESHGLAKDTNSKDVNKEMTKPPADVVAPKEKP